MRHAKKWSQEDMAEKLDMSVNGYANIEHGNSNLHIKRLNQIAEIFGMDLLELFNIGERGILCFIGGNYQNGQINSGKITNYSNEATELKHEIEKLHLILEKKDQEIKHLKEKK